MANSSEAVEKFPFGIPAAAKIHVNDTRREIARSVTEDKISELVVDEGVILADAMLAAGVPPRVAHKRVTEIRDSRGISGCRNERKRNTGRN